MSPLLPFFPIPVSGVFTPAVPSSCSAPEKPAKQTFTSKVEDKAFQHNYSLTATCKAISRFAMHRLSKSICSKVVFSIVVGTKVDEKKRAVLRSNGGKEISLSTQDNLKLEGMQFTNPKPVENAQTIIICSGSRGSYEQYTVPMVDALLRLGHHVLVFNYRGFGKNEGSPSEKGFYLDVEAAYQHLKNQGLSSDQMTVFGYSLGTAVATDLAARHQIKLFLDRYFSSMRSVAEDQFGHIGKSVVHLGKADFDITEKIKQVKGPIFLARGVEDEVMNPSHQQHLLRAFVGYRNACFVEVPSGHSHSSY